MQRTTKNSLSRTGFELAYFWVYGLAIRLRLPIPVGWIAQFLERRYKNPAKIRAQIPFTFLLHFWFTGCLNNGRFVAGDKDKTEQTVPEEEPQGDDEEIEGDEEDEDDDGWDTDEFESDSDDRDESLPNKRQSKIIFDELHDIPELVMCNIVFCCYTRHFPIDNLHLFRDLPTLRTNSLKFRPVKMTSTYKP